MKNRLFCLLVVLACALMVTGCGRDTQSSQQETNTVSLELGEDNPAPGEEPEKTPSPSEQLEEIRPDGQTEPTEETAEEESQQEQTDEQPASETEQQAEESAVETETPVTTPQTSLPFPQELQTRPSEELKNNPQQLDSRLYAVFQNVMEQNFDRKKGTLSVYRLNYDGTEGAYELEYDLTNAYDEEGKLNKNMEIDAQLKVAETMQSNINYGQGSREIYTSYDQYAETLDWLKSPLLCDGFALQNFSSLTLTEEENGIWRITATYTPEALRELYDQDIDGVVTSLIELDKDGNLQLLRWEQTEEVNDYPTVIACGEYSFS